MYCINRSSLNQIKKRYNNEKYSNHTLTLHTDSVLLVDSCFGGITAYYMVSSYQEELEEAEAEIMGNVQES